MTGSLVLPQCPTLTISHYCTCFHCVSRFLSSRGYLFPFFSFHSLLTTNYARGCCYEISCTASLLCPLWLVRLS